jgi:hypothetical protein
VTRKTESIPGVYKNGTRTCGPKQLPAWLDEDPKEPVKNPVPDPVRDVTPKAGLQVAPGDGGRFVFIEFDDGVIEAPMDLKIREVNAINQILSFTWNQQK